MPRLRLFLVSLGAGTITALLVLGGLLVGVWLDGLMGSAPWLSLLFVFAGLALSPFLVYRLVMWGFDRQR